MTNRIKEKEKEYRHYHWLICKNKISKKGIGNLLLLRLYISLILQKEFSKRLLHH
jgi:hypothetical protein